jgi:hypothetical protein
MEQKLTPKINFTFEQLGEVEEINTHMEMNPHAEPIKRKIKITDLTKPRKLTKDGSTRLF